MLEKIEKLEIFKDAFSIGGSSNYEYCNCGKLFVEDKEFDNELPEDDLVNSIECGSGVYRLQFEGKQYVEQCNCWQPRANQIIDFIDTHSRDIVNYLNAVKRKSIQYAHELPEVY